jgi:hypothetical protein
MAERPSKTKKEEVDALTSTITSLSTMVSTLTRTVSTLANQQPSPRDAQRFERRGLSEASTSVHDASAEASAALAEMNQAKTVEPSAPTHTGLGHALEAYAKYLALFVGAGLISGSIVHFPLDPSRYILVGIIGALLFSGASALGDIRTNGLSRSILRIVIASLVLSLGIGMISGGIQHFEDFPGRAALLIPIGMVVSVVAFLVRQGYRLSGQHMMWLASGGVWVVMIVGFGLNALASGASDGGGEAGGHGHGVTTETTVATVPAQPAAPTQSAAAVQPAAVAQTTPPIEAGEHEDDGHGH